MYIVYTNDAIFNIEDIIIQCKVTITDIINIVKRYNGTLISNKVLDKNNLLEEYNKTHEYKNILLVTFKDITDAIKFMQLVKSWYISIDLYKGAFNDISC